MIKTIAVAKNNTSLSDKTFFKLSETGYLTKGWYNYCSLNLSKMILAQSKLALF